MKINRFGGLQVDVGPLETNNENCRDISNLRVDNPKFKPNNEIGYEKQRTIGLNEIITNIIQIRENATSSNIGIGAWTNLFYNFTSPEDVYVYENVLYVLDQDAQVVSKFSKAGRFISSFSLGFTVEGFCITGDSIFLTDGDNHRIYVTDLDGNLDTTIGSQGSGNGEFDTPQGITYFGNEFYVTEEGNNRVQVFNAAGVYQRQWGSAGTGNGQFTDPESVIGYNSEIYVIEAGGQRVQVFDTDGNYQRKWSLGTGADGTGIFHYQGEIYTCDESPAIQVFNTTGTLQRTLGAGDTTEPKGIYVDSGWVYIADGGAQSVYRVAANGD